jgi:hypothetical protein
METLIPPSAPSFSRYWRWLALVSVLLLWCLLPLLACGPLNCSVDEDCLGGRICDQKRKVCVPAPVGCEPGQKRNCNTGDATLVGRGVCKAGQQLCTQARRWGNCTGEVLPSTELCNDRDDNCNGLLDDNCRESSACPGDLAASLVTFAFRRLSAPSLWEITLSFPTTSSYDWVASSLQLRHPGSSKKWTLESQKALPATRPKTIVLVLRTSNGWDDVQRLKIKGQFWFRSDKEALRCTLQADSKPWNVPCLPWKGSAELRKESVCCQGEWKSRDPLHCGACHRACATSDICENNLCVRRCKGQDDCGDGELCRLGLCRTCPGYKHCDMVSTIDTPRANIISVLQIIEPVGHNACMLQSRHETIKTGAATNTQFLFRVSPSCDASKTTSSSLPQGHRGFYTPSGKMLLSRRIRSPYNSQAVEFSQWDQQGRKEWGVRLQGGYNPFSGSVHWDGSQWWAVAGLAKVSALKCNATSLAVPPWPQNNGTPLILLPLSTSGKCGVPHVIAVKDVTFFETKTLLEGDDRVWIAGTHTAAFSLAGTSFPADPKSNAFVLLYSRKQKKVLWIRSLASIGADRVRGFVRQGDELVVALQFEGALNVADRSLKPVGGVDLALLRFDLKGSLKQSQIFGGPDNEWTSTLVQSPSGRLYLTGFFDKTAHFAGRTLTTRGGRDVWLLGVGTDGAVTFLEKAGGKLDDIATALSWMGEGWIRVGGGLRSPDARFGAVKVSAFSENKGLGFVWSLKVE